MRHLEYNCHMNRSGYAQSAQDYICALLENGEYDICVKLLHASPDKVSMTQEMYIKITNLMQRQPFASDVQIIHGIPDKQFHIKKGKKSIGFATFETFGPPEHWIKILNENDAIIVPSKFNETVFRQAGINKPIFHIPHCVNTSIYNKDVVSCKEYEEFVFLFFGTWKKRKGWQQLIETWFRTFDKHDNVRLVLKTDTISMAQRGIEEIKQSLGLKKDFAPISFETKILNELEIPLLIKKTDCLISPSIGEGFGIPGLQAMALGVPIIVTDFSGFKDYANEETATLIKPNGFIHHNQMDNIPQFKDKKWSYITVEEISNKMKYVLSNIELVRQKANLAADFVSDNFNYSLTANKFDKMLDSIL